MYHMKIIPFPSFSQTAANDYYDLPNAQLYDKHRSCYTSYTHSKNLPLFPQCISTNKIRNQKVIVEEVYYSLQ